jgi:hypothetical protein
MTDLPANEDKPTKPVTAEQQVVQLNVRVPLHMRIKLSALSEINGVDMQELVSKWIAEKLIENEDEVRKFLSFR